MKITQQRLKEIIKEELLTEEVGVPRTWMRHAAGKLKQASRHVSPDMNERLMTMVAQIMEMVEEINLEQSRLPSPPEPR
jgi:hypothetical protein